MPENVWCTHPITKYMEIQSLVSEMKRVDDNGSILCKERQQTPVCMLVNFMGL
jgi:hypothetical protein